MLIAYFDEVKYEPDRQPYYWLGAIIADAESIWRLENAVAELSMECFGTPTMSRETEFHACELFHRKRNFKGWSDVKKRIGVLEKLLEILDSVELGKVEIRVEPQKMVKSDFEEMAFVFLVEKVESYLHQAKSPGIQVSKKFSEMLSQCRAEGTPYQFGKSLKYLIDTVHFTNSHHSRMLQLADLYVWISQLCTVGDDKRSPQAELIQFVRDKTNIWSPNRYKHWPTEDSWIRV
jgi:hypothetical protein